ncbi:MAG: PDZ domain-containing protein [Planctomycetes bacterium]|nr:PDZ domain-containing protein [Planctomycetota bacterium]
MRYRAAMWLVVGTALGWPAGLSPGAEKASSPPTSASPSELAVMIQKLRGSLVRVEVTPRFDGGEAPRDSISSPSEGGCVAKAAADSASASFITESWGEIMKEERPAAVGGFLVAPDRVFTAELALHPRFVKSIVIKLGDEAVPASVDGYLEAEPGMFLRLERPLAGGKPLVFSTSSGEPAVGIRYVKVDGEWTILATPTPGGVMVSESGKAASRGAGNTLLLDRSDAPITILSGGHLPVDGSWRIDPSQKKIVSAVQWKDIIARVSALAERQIPRVHIQFRSPTAETGRRRNMHSDDNERVDTDWYGEGLLLGDKEILIPIGFDPKTTARLEKITVHFPDGTQKVARFSGTLRDWKGLVGSFDESVGPGITLRDGAISDLRDALLVEGLIAVKGETRTAHFGTQRVRDFHEGFRGTLYPTLDAVIGSGRWSDSGLAYRAYLFTTDGQLVALPMARRDRLGGGDRSYSRSDDDVLMPAGVLGAVVRQGEGAYDPDNKPLSKEHEQRLAWLGVEMQEVNPDLARANNIVEMTNGGRSGGIVTYVYADSPAAKAGVEVGDVLLRLKIEGQPKPLEIEVEEHGPGGMMERFWEVLDRVPEEYFDRIPAPWGSAETPVTRALTDVGFGTPFTIEAARAGKQLEFPMVVTLGPPHYDAAPKFKSEDLGITVRDMTYEVRRYFQMKPEDSGVIISKIERGGRAAVAGLKPLEIVKSVNDVPISNIKDFEAAIKSGGELKMSVKRMTQGRTVVVKPGNKPEKKPADTGN